MNDGRSADALVDFTGGVAEKLVLTRLDLNDTKIVDQLFYKLKESCDNSALMNCNIEVRLLYHMILGLSLKKMYINYNLRAKKIS